MMRRGQNEMRREIIAERRIFVGKVVEAVDKAEAGRCGLDFRGEAGGGWRLFYAILFDFALEGGSRQAE